MEEPVLVIASSFISFYCIFIRDHSKFKTLIVLVYIVLPIKFFCIVKGPLKLNIAYSHSKSMVY